MTASVLPNGKQYYATPAGIPAVGWKVATFDAGTTNPRQTFTDAAGVTPNTNPVILDGRGEAVIFWSGNYKVQLQDNLGNVIWTVDNLSSIASATFTSLTDGPGSYIGAALKRLRVNAAATGIEYIADTFTNLQDTFTSYAGKALQLLRINAGMTAIESFAQTLVTAFLQLTDVSPASYAGKTGQSVVVNALETGLTFDGNPLGDGSWVLSGGQAVVATIDSTLQFATAEYSLLKRGTFSTSTYFYTAGASGARIQVTVNTSIAALAASATMRVYIEKNSVTKVGQGFKQSFAGGSTLEMQCEIPSKDITLAAGETIRVRIVCSSNQTVDSDASKTYLSIVELA